MLWWLIAISLILLAYYYSSCYNGYWAKAGVPHLKPIPLLGNMAMAVFKTWNFQEMFDHFYYAFPNARYTGIYSFTSPTLMIRDTDLIKRITIKDFDHFVDHTVMLTEENDALFGRTLVSLSGQRWKNMRATLSPAFTSSKMRSMFTLISETAVQFSQHFLKEVKEYGELELEMTDTFRRFANDVIATTAFGIECDSFTNRDNDFFVLGQKTSDLSGIAGLKFLGYLMIPSVMKALNVQIFNPFIHQFFRGLIKNSIETREREGIVRHDMLHLLMEARKGKLENEEQGDVKDEFAAVEEITVGKTTELSDDDITAQALLFFLAGFSTVSTALTFLMYELAINVEIQQKLQKEVDVTYTNCDKNLTYEVLLKMKYLDMVISESLRKWPAGPVIERLCVKPYTIEPIDKEEKPVVVEKGVSVWIPVYSIHRDLKYYPEPDKFDPERFNDENKHNIMPYTYLPFSVGPRNCIGSRFALLEMKTILFYTMLHFDLYPSEKTQIPLQLGKNSFSILPKEGVWLEMKLRDKK